MPIHPLILGYQEHGLSIARLDSQTFDKLSPPRLTTIGCTSWRPVSRMFMRLGPASHICLV